MEETNQSFKARILKNELKEIADKFPPEEKYRLTDSIDSFFQIH